MSVRRRERTEVLPAAANGFVGRGPELDKISILLLGSARLVTLIGSGGVGKTRLAAEAVRRFQRARRTSVYWVRLARLSRGADTASIEEEIAQSVLDADFSGRSAWDALVDTLNETDAGGRTQQTVLVMDNCEHVIDGAGRVIADLLDAVPALTVLVTSREAVGWVDEQLLAVPPLTQDQALDLFRQRAELTGHSVTDLDQIAIANRICRHVHNHPLYVRLAAARLLRQPMPMILQELNGSDNDRRMQWSHGPRVGADARHQGVSDVIAWSYDLCDDKERLLLERMSVFAAGYDTNPEDDDGRFGLDVGADLEAFEMVCTDEPGSDNPGSNAEHAFDPAYDTGVLLPRDEVKSLLERLADQSLISVHITPNSVRYSLLESIRLFARQRLHERAAAGGLDEPALLAKRHRQYYRDKVAQAHVSWFSPAEQDVFEWARTAWDNILDAIEGSITAPGEAAIGLEISTTLISLGIPFSKGTLREMRRWTERTLAASRTLDPQPLALQNRAKALIIWLTLCQGQQGDAAHMLEECVLSCITDPVVRKTWQSDPETDIGLPATVDFAWGTVLMMVDCDPRAITVFARAREKLGRRGNRGGGAVTGLLEAEAACFLGTPEQAVTIARRNLDSFTEAGARWAGTWAELVWALALTKDGRPAEALEVGREAMAHQHAAGDQWGTSWAVHVRMWSLARLIEDLTAAGGNDRRRIVELATEIAQLDGGSRIQRVRLGVNLEGMGPFRDETVHAVDVARRVLGPSSFQAAEKQGSLLRTDLGELQQLALGTLTIDRMPVDHPARKDAPSHWADLTAAEVEVATLAAAGWTNTAIAARRGNSYKTVDAQMAAIFQKLMIVSRADIISFVPEDRLGVVRTEASRKPRRNTDRPPAHPR